MSQRGFAAGTLVHSEDGLRAIETVAIGDRVLAGAGDGTAPTLRTVRDVLSQRAEVVLLAFAHWTRREPLGSVVCGIDQAFHVGARDAGGGMTQPVGEWQPVRAANGYTLLTGRRDPRLRAAVPLPLRRLPQGGLWAAVGDGVADGDGDGDGARGIALAELPPGAPWPPAAELLQARPADELPGDPAFAPEPGEEHLLWWEAPARIVTHRLVLDGRHGYHVHAVGVLARD